MCWSGRRHPTVLARRASHVASNKQQGVCKQAISRVSKWAVFKFMLESVDSFHALAGHLRHHAATDFHRLCSNVFESPHYSRPLAPITVNEYSPQQPAAQYAAAQPSAAQPSAARVPPAAPMAGQRAAPRAAAAPPMNIDSIDAVAGHIHDPFRGKGVPQRQEWIDLWADSSSCVSMRKQEVLKQKRGHILSARGVIKRKRAMLRVAAEVTRVTIRKIIRNATSISLAIDECDTRKIIRLRCDMPKPPYRWDGVMCICKKLYGITDDLSRELKDDHAVHNRRLFEGSLQSFYMPLKPHVKRRYVRRLVQDRRPIDEAASGAAPPSGGAVPPSGGAAAASGKATTSAKRTRSSTQVRAECNTADLADFVKKVRILASDGGHSERRAVFLVAEKYFPNVHFVVEDPAHGLRIALTKPLQLEPYFKEISEALYVCEHSLIQDIQNSGKWKEVLKGLQETTMKIPGLQRDGALKVVLSHLVYAKVRMDSTADPLAKLCLMLMPIAYLLSFMASDERNTPTQRARAADMLAKFQPKFCIGAGVSADWGLICLRFLRLFDRLDHDISNSEDEMADFFQTVDGCFIQGGVFRNFKRKDQPEEHADRNASPPANGPDLFITERVRRQTRHKCVFHVGDRDQLVWGPIQPKDVEDLSRSLATAAKAMKNRVGAKLAGVRRHFSCFALRRLDRIDKATGEQKEQLRFKILDSVRELGRIFNIDTRILVYEFKEVSGEALRLYKAELAKQPAAPADGTEEDTMSFDNRIVWRRFFDQDYIQKAFKARVSPFTALQTLLRIYMSVLDGESQVERDLGTMRSFFKTMKGRCNEDLLNDLLILKLSGPQTAEEARGAFAQQCAELWLKHMGNHGLHSRPRAQRQPAAQRRKIKKHSFAEAKRSVFRAAARAKTPGHHDEQTAFGVKAGVLDMDKRPLDPACANRAPLDDCVNLKKFEKQSKDYKALNERMCKAGRDGIPVFRASNSTKPATLLDFVHITKLAYLPQHDAAANGPIAAGYTQSLGLHACKTAEMVIVDKWERLHEEYASPAWVIHLCYIVARGLPVTTAAEMFPLRGDLRSLPAHSVREHVPLMYRRIRFFVTQELNRTSPELASCIRAVQNMKSSCWRVEVLKEDDETQLAAPAAGCEQQQRKWPKVQAKAKGFAKRQLEKKLEVHIPDLPTMWRWLQAERRCINAPYTRMCWRAGQTTAL